MKDAADIPKSAMRSFEGRLGYLRSVLAPARPLRIADVGANPVNVPDYTDLQTMGGCEVWGFEPEPEAFAALQDQPRPGATNLQRAVGPTGAATFYPHPQSGLGSLLKIDATAVAFLGHPRWHSKQGQGEPVDLVSLDDLVAGEVPKPDLLKIDIQGGELDVFRTGRDALSDAVAVITEVRFARIYADEPLWGDLDAELRTQGFALHKLMFTKSVAVGNSMRQQMRKPVLRNQMMDGDAVYIRAPSTIADWTDEQIKQLAIAAAGVFDSCDLVIHCLDQLVLRGLIPPETPADFFRKLPKWMRK